MCKGRVVKSTSFYILCKLLCLSKQVTSDAMLEFCNENTYGKLCDCDGSDGICDYPCGPDGSCAMACLPIKDICSNLISYPSFDPKDHRVLMEDDGHRVMRCRTSSDCMTATASESDVRCVIPSYDLASMLHAYSGYCCLITGTSEV